MTDLATGQEWFSANELAGLPGMPNTDRGVRLLAEKNLLVTRSKLRGKGLEYSRSSLPTETREFLERRDTEAVLRDLGIPPETSAQTPAQTPGQTPAQTPAANAAAAAPASTAAQRATELARSLVVHELRAIQRVHGCRARRAAQLLLERARSGALLPALRAKLEQACDARGRSAAQDDGLPSLVTLQRWERAQRAGRGLAPLASAQVSLAVRPWYRAFFALTDRPQKPTLRWAHEQLLANWRPEWSDRADGAPPSYHAAVRAYDKRSAIDKLRGRHTGSALRAKTFYHQRTYAGLAPFTEVHADGWTTHFTAPHPVDGRFVTYEVWHFHDTATRFVTPPAIGMTENTDTILDGLRKCIGVGGLIAIWQTDHTSSVKNARLLEEHSGLADRLGITIVHPLAVGNSQANGIAENFNAWLDREARALATYQHPQRMDSASFVRIRRITNAMVRAAERPAERAALRAQAVRLGKGIVFDTYADAVGWITGCVDKWNDKPHRALPKVRDAAGRLTHMTPRQSLDAAIAAGWQPMAVPAEVLADQFRPHIRKAVYRGCVTPFAGQRYHHRDLAHLEGQDVLVAVDRDNPGEVDVKDLHGRLLVRCALIGAVQGRTQSMKEHTERKRAAARVRLRENQIEGIGRQLEPLVIEAPAKSVLDLPAPPVREREPARKTLADLPPAPERPSERRRMTPLEGFMHLQALAEARAAAGGPDHGTAPDCGLPAGEAGEDAEPAKKRAAG